MKFLQTSQMKARPTKRGSVGGPGGGSTTGHQERAGLGTREGGEVGSDEGWRGVQSRSPGPLRRLGHLREHILEVEVPLHVAVLQDTRSAVGAKLEFPPARAPARSRLSPAPAFNRPRHTRRPRPRPAPRL